MASNDGSNMGIDAERAIETILGGKESPIAEEKQTREQVRVRLGKAPRLLDITSGIEGLSYGGCTDIATRAILDFMEGFPQFADAPIENEYAPDAWKGFDGDSKDFPIPTKLGIYDHMKANGYSLEKLDLTGFMWGFAFNTAKWLRYEEPGPNPAILEI